MDRKLTAIAAGLIALSVVLGAFGAHALKKVLTPEELSSFEVGVRYQVYHGLALFVMGIHSRKFPNGSKLVVNLMLIGLLLFSLSIYLLSLDRLWGMELTWLGPVTPLGGGCMIAAWVLLIVRLMQGQRENESLNEK